MAKYIQVVTYKKLPNRRKEFTEEIAAETPSDAWDVIKAKLGCDIAVTKSLTTIPSSVEGSGPKF